jgi:tRNA1(Val) A37 N6-methylase TrmN6
VLEAGTGAGAGLLALAARVRDVAGTGVELDPAMAALARENLAANGRDALCIENADITCWRAPPAFDHAFANPPWHDPGGSPSPDPARRLAKQATGGLLAQWAASLAACLKRRGTLSLILPAASLALGIEAMVKAQCGEIVLLPLWRRAGDEAKLIILRGTRLGQGGCSVLPGLVLHGPDGQLTPEAEAILRDAAPLASRQARSATDTPRPSSPRPAP